MLGPPFNYSACSYAKVLKDYPGFILAVIGAESLRPYLSCPVRLIQCDAVIFGRFISDISSILRFEGENHQLQLARPGFAFGDVEDELRASDALTFSPELLSLEAYLRRIVAGDARDVVVETGNSDPKLLWETAADQWDESFYLRLLDDFGLLHRQFATDDELIANAIERDWLMVLRRLAGAGVRFDQPGADGEFPLHRAVLHGKIGIVKFLLSLGVDPIPRARDGKTPLGRTMYCGDAAGKQLHEILWPLEWPAASKRLTKLDELTRPKPS